ncbi:MAG TPA: DUF4124 domain-containing protein [Proteobacteria bacterium]|nr:DUF4124 domain-containing protein [Pseudomonadota bacterium]
MSGRVACRAIAAVVLVVCVCAAALADRAKSFLLYRWMDAQGRYHYTDDYSQIPPRFRHTVVVGRFVVEGPTSPPGQSGRGEAGAGEEGVVILQDTYNIRDGFLHIEGRVKNLLDHTITEVRANIEFYDRFNNLITARSVYLVPSTLRPGEIGVIRVAIPAMTRFHYYKTEIDYRSK